MADFSRDNKTYSSDYADLGGYQDAFNKYVNQLGGVHSDSDQARSTILSQLDSSIGQFKSLFNNTVGRDATDAEVEKYIKESGTDSLTNGVQGEGLRNTTQQYIGDTFQQQAQDTAKNKLSDLSSQAGGLADQYTALANKSLSSLSDSLRQYQTTLFDKLRPQMNLSAQAQGIQDSGGQTLQEQGSLRDLGNQATGYLLPIQQQYQDQANAIRYGGASAPYSLATSFAANQPAALAGAAGGALNFNDQNAFANYSQQRQLQLLGAQNLLNQNYFENTRPSFGYGLGQSFSNQFGGNLGKEVGTGLGQNFNSGLSHIGSALLAGG